MSDDIQTRSIVDLNCDREKEEKEKDQENQCPLFMEGLPNDFANNAALAAIANLLDDENKDDEENNSSKRYEVTLPGGGGKVSKRNSSLSRSLNRRKPYNIAKKPKSNLGEAQLFLKMWKI